jgi:hypothetical protein
MTDDTDEQAKQEAQALLDRLGTERKKLEARLDDVQKETHDAIVDILMARTLGPSEVARRVQYDRQHVARIAKKAGVPPLREATVVSRAKAGVPKEPRAAVAAPRQQVTQSLPKVAPTVSAKVRELPADRVSWLANKAEELGLEWVSEIRREYPHLKGPDLDYVIVDTGHQKGLTIPELAEQSEPDPAAPERPQSSEETSG